MHEQQPIDDISPAVALERARGGVRLFDIRSAGERAAGMAETATGVAMEELLADPTRVLANPDTEAMLICASGRRSRRVVEALAVRGYTRLRSVAGGTAAWQACGLPLGDALESAAFLERYSRHLLLPEVGLQGQRRLRDARVALIGAGGLGSPAALYLAAAGVGQLRLIDDDRVERSNLQRQVLHRDADVGRSKVESARSTLLGLNPDIAIEPIAQRLDAGNVDALLSGVDVVVDGSDNFVTRYLVNHACAGSGVPLVYGAVERFHGQIAVFWPRRPGARGSCYRCLFPEAPAAAFAPNCAEAGVLGVLPGLIGMLQAIEAIKLILRIGEPLVDRLLRVDVLGMQFRPIGLSRDPHCGSCGDQRETGYRGVESVCSAD